MPCNTIHWSHEYKNMCIWNLPYLQYRNYVHLPYLRYHRDLAACDTSLNSTHREMLGKHKQEWCNHAYACPFNAQLRVWFFLCLHQASYHFMCMFHMRGGCSILTLYECRFHQSWVWCGDPECLWGYRIHVFDPVCSNVSTHLQLPHFNHTWAGLHLLWEGGSSGWIGLF